MVKLDPLSQADFDRLADLPIDTPNGGLVPVRVLAEVRREEGPNMVLRENIQRRIVISCNVAGRDLGSVVQDLQAAVGAAVPMPAGYASNTAASSRASRAPRDGCWFWVLVSWPDSSCCWYSHSAVRAMRC